MEFLLSGFGGIAGITTMTDYLIYDVFTDTPFGGNPLAIVPDARALPAAHLQTIAAEFNLSETVFLYPPDDPAHTARARIFTPVSELPFAGHPTIGSAVALSDLGHGSALVLELGVGPIPCRVEAGQARFTTRTPLDLAGEVDLTLMAACAGLTPDEISTDRHPPLRASVGIPFAICEVASHEVLARARPDTAAFRTCAEVYPVKDDFFSALFYLRDGDAISARMFAPLSNIPEDPATGSAAAALGALLANLAGRPLSLTMQQGVEMGRPSTIGIEVEVENGAYRAVSISGAAVKVMEGRLCL